MRGRRVRFRGGADSLKGRGEGARGSGSEIGPGPLSPFTDRTGPPARSLAALSCFAGGEGASASGWRRQRRKGVAVVVAEGRAFVGRARRAIRLAAIATNF